MRYLAAVAVLLTLVACDSDNVFWEVTSNPSGTEPRAGGTVIVIVKSTLPQPQHPAGGIDQAPAEDFEPERDGVEVYLVTEVDEVDFGSGDAVLRGRSLLGVETAR